MKKIALLLTLAAIGCDEPRPVIHLTPPPPTPPVLSPDEARWERLNNKMVFVSRPYERAGVNKTAIQEAASRALSARYTLHMRDDCPNATGNYVEEMKVVGKRTKSGRGFFFDPTLCTRCIE